MKHRRLLAATALAAAAASAYGLACGPFLTDYRSVTRIRPAHPEAYRQGQVGVVRPRFERRYLVQAYRRFTGLPPLQGLVESSSVSDAPQNNPIEEWLALRATIVSDPQATARRIMVNRSLPDYQWFLNCHDDAFATAIRTGQARIARYGAASPQTRDWFAAQDAVFENCDGQSKAPVLPAAAPSTADASAKADREYQTAAAYFYAMRYDDAAARFRAIGDTPGSAWRPFGHYLAARALIRSATVPQTPEPSALTTAERELRLALADPQASALHASARGLLELIAVRARPIERLRDLSAILATASAADAQQITDYRRVMDRLLGDTTEFPYEAIAQRDAVAQTSDLNDWILAMQGTGAAARERALIQWKKQGSVHWQIAALWHLAPTDPEVPGVLRAAGAVRTSSPAYPTVSFLRARLLFHRGEHDAARAVLAGLPLRPGEHFEPETINLLAALRMALAPGFDVFLANAPRTIVAAVEPGYPVRPPVQKAPVFDEDAAMVLSQQLPVARLVQAATGPLLPARLRLKVAGVAFVRAILLQQHDAALAVAPVLRTLAPSLRADLERFESAGSTADRHLAAIRLLLRTPGLRGSVSGQEDDESLSPGEPTRKFDHVFRRHWWCSFERNGQERQIHADAEIFTLIHGARPIQPPPFLSADDRAAAERELSVLAKLGPAPNYLAAESVKWARARPGDADAAEALAHAVEGTRWGCTDSSTSNASRVAFQTLHRLFPKSDWARRTRYWY